MPHHLAPSVAFAFAVSLPWLCAQEPVPAKTLSPEQLASAEAFARQLVEDLIAQRTDAVIAVFDRDAIVSAVLDGIDAKNADVEALRKGMENGIDGSLRDVAAEWYASAPKWKRIVVTDGQPSARFRFTGPSGLSIVDLALVPHGTSWRVADFHNRALGLSLVEQVRQSVATMLGDAGGGVLARIFGNTGLSAADAKNVADMMAARARGDFAGALAAHAKLPKAVQDTSLVTTVFVQCLSQGEDTGAYVAALEAAAKRFPAPMFRFTLIDAHFLKKDWKKAIACVDECMLLVERDAAMLALRAQLQMQSGDVPGAHKTLREAMQLEPDCEYALANGLDVWLAVKDWAAVRDAMVALEKTGKYQFRGQIDDDLWAEFRKAPESERWR